MLTALEAVVEGWTGRVLRYLKSALSPLDPAACDRLENYVITWGLGGKPGGSHFDPSPGLGLPWGQPEDRGRPGGPLNRGQETGVLPLVRMQTTMARARNTLEQLEALYAYLEEIRSASASGGCTAFEAAETIKGA